MIDEPFSPFKKIPRLYREVVVTEKIDGTNAVVRVYEDGTVRAGSRNRWITPGSDNFGFAAWVEAHAEELRGLGPGWHRGEWWGRGIQRGYGLAERRFSLFNVHAWGDAGNRPACCDVVPTLAVGADPDAAVREALARLRAEGSLAVQGYDRPEGCVMYHTASGHYYKVLLEGDDRPKGVA